MEDVSKQLRLGKKISIEVIRNDTTDVYESKILDVFQPDVFIISGPIKKNAPIPISKNAKIIVEYYVQNQGRFNFNAKVLSHRIGNIYQLKIIKKSETQRIQERDFYRLEIILNIIKHYKTDGEIVEENCMVQDISGSGMRLLSNYQHQIDDIISISMTLEKENLILRSRVVRVNEINNANYKYAIGVNFFSLSSKTKDKIIKYIFKEQRKYRKKGLI